MNHLPAESTWPRSAAPHLPPADDDAPGAASRGSAAALALSAFFVPALINAPVAPTPNHPRTLLWYALLRKPGFKPPDVAIPIAWTAIEAGLAFGGYRLLRSAPSAARKRALGWWAANVAMIGGWSGIFFGAKNLPASTFAAAALIGSGAAYVHEAAKVDRPAAAAGIPLVAWVGFATVLTAAIWRRNR